MKPKSYPKFQQERVRLRLRLETYKQFIQDDLHELKQSVRPVALAKNVFSQAGDQFKNKMSFSTGAGLALKFIPAGSRIGTIGRMLVPLVVKNIPGIARFMAEKKPGFKKSAMLGGLRNAVHKIRTRISPQNEAVKP